MKSTIKHLIVSLLVCFGYLWLSSQPVNAAPTCSLIGNNLAVQFGRSGTDYKEAQYTLALLEGPENVPAIISAISSTPNIVIIRLGASVTSRGPADPEVYAGLLKQIAAAPQVAGKPFVATAGHNEPNCQGFVPLNSEVAYVTTVANSIENSEFKDQITLITGQIDSYCGDRSEAETQSYIEKLTDIPGIEGLALPYYITDPYPTADAANSLFDKMASLTNLPIYITESGPYRAGSMPEFVKGVSTINGSQIQAFLLFNALGLNPEFTYARPFFNPACRAAFRNSCTDSQTVLDACGVSTDADEVYYYPIEGLAERNSSQILNNLVDQGYQVQCSTPKFSVEVVQGGQIEKFISLVDQGIRQPIDRTVTSSLIYDLTQVQIPNWRSASGGDPNLFASLENYWSVHHIIDNTDPENIIKASPIYRILSPEQQCQYKVHLLETTRNMCNKLADPSKCALYQPINGTDYTTQTLLDDFQSSGLQCSDIINPGLSESQLRVKEALSHAPLYLDRAYRLAFLVVSGELKDDNSPLRFFNFLRPNRSSSPRHEIRVVAFKIPDIGTNKAPGDLNYSDPLQITRDSITDLDIINQWKEDFDAEKTKLKTGGEAGLVPAIECGGENCNDALTQALINIINRSGASCEANPQDLQAEESTGAIQTSGKITSGPGTLFQDGSDPAKDLFTSPEDQRQEPQRASFSFLSDLKLGVRGTADTKVKAFLVIPTGHELETTEEALTAFFDINWVEEFDNNPDIKNYFKLNGVDARFSSGKVTASFNDPNPVPCSVDPDDDTPPIPGQVGLQPCFNSNQIEAEIKAQQNDTEPRILGAKLGYLTRKIQETLRGFDSPQFIGLQNCRTTEDFLTGKCTGQISGGGGIPGPDGIDHPDGTGPAPGSGRGCQAVSSGPCSVANLTKYFTNSPGMTAQQKATYASIVCNRESAGKPTARNLSCTLGQGGTDYSIGLFQINTLAHCPGAFNNWKIGDAQCTIANASALQACVTNLYDPDVNIRKMVELTTGYGTMDDGMYWWHWLTVSRDCNIPLIPLN